MMNLMQICQRMHHKIPIKLINILKVLKLVTNNNTIIYTNNFGYINGFEHITQDKIPKKIGR